MDSNKNALEIGIGTGQATLPFLKTGCRLTAVELGEDMAQFSKEKFAKFHNFNIINNDFENVYLVNDNYDLIYSATAFHWIPKEVGYPKVFNLLKSGGTLAMFWNHPSLEDDELNLSMQGVYNKYTTNNNSTVHKFGVEKCLDITETIRKHGFVDVEYRLYHQTRVFDAPQYMALLNTYSHHRARKEETRILLESQLSDVINNFGGKIHIKDTMDLYLARKL